MQFGVICACTAPWLKEYLFPNLILYYKTKTASPSAFRTFSTRAAYFISIREGKNSFTSTLFCFVSSLSVNHDQNRWFLAKLHWKIHSFIHVSIKSKRQLVESETGELLKLPWVAKRLCDSISRSKYYLDVSHSVVDVGKFVVDIFNSDGSLMRLLFRFSLDRITNSFYAS